MCPNSITDTSKATGAAVLPASYREALNTLTVNADSSNNNPSLSTLSDESLLALTKELLSHFYSTKGQWVGGDWSAGEAELLRLAGSAADFNKGAGAFVLGSLVGDYLRTLVDALEYKLDENKTQPELLSKVRKVGDHEVYGPIAVGDSLALYSGTSFEVWTSPTPDAGDKTNESDDSESIVPVSVVLGAGNQNCLSIMDVLDNALRRRRPVLLKHHPLRPFLSEPYGIILEPLIKRGYLAQVQDVSIDATKTLLSDPAVGHVHITGALKTAQAVHDTLQKAHPQLSSEKIKSMITSELGCVTPQILDDGVYTELELQHACQIITFGKKFCGGCNCLSAQVVVLPKHWAQKNLFRSKLLDELKRQPTTPCYYPGSVERKASIVGKCQQAGSKCTTVVAASVSEETKISEADQVCVVECGSPGDEGYNSDPLLSEAFGPVLAIVELDHEESDEDDYLAKTAVPFVNDKDNIFGSLSCSVFTPLSKGKTSDRKGLQSALAALLYGSIGVNQCNAFGYITIAKGGKWGGHPLEKLGQSGNGHIGDQYGIIGSKNAKAIVYGPSLGRRTFVSDLASTPPPIVFEVLMELKCTPSVLGGLMSAFKMVMIRSVHGIISYLPLVGRFFQ